MRAKRAVLIAGAAVPAGAAGPFLAPTLGAITLGLVGQRMFDRQFGKNQSFNSAGNVFAALLIAAVSHLFGNRAIFLVAAALTVPTVVAVRLIRGDEIDYERARGGGGKQAEGKEGGTLAMLARDRVLLVFLACAFLFHLANAAMLPQLGEMLSQGSASSAAPFMSACIIVTQAVIMCSAAFVGRFANSVGRKPLLLVGFGVLPVRALLYTLTHRTGALIAIQVLDGVANAIFGVVAVLVAADRTRGTGRFNLVQGALATAVGIGAALSTTVGGKLIQYFSYRVSFLTLGGIAVAAFGLVLVGLPETREG